MSAITFPNVVNPGDVLAAGSTVWQFTSNVWDIVSYRVADYGNIDAGNTPGAEAIIALNAGVPKSVFGASKSINGGEV